jgi:hypothetical protein
MVRLATLIDMEDQESVVIGKRPADRYVGLLIASPLLLMGVAAAVLNPHGIPTKSGTVSPAFALLPAAVLMVIALSAVGPSELEIQPGRRRYRLIAGLPLLARPTSGPFEDIKSIALRAKRPSNGTSIMSVRVEVEWRQPNRKPTLLKYVRLSEAYDLKSLLIAQSGLPIVWDVD